MRYFAPFAALAGCVALASAAPICLDTGALQSPLDMPYGHADTVQSPLSQPPARASRALPAC